ncbi:MAG: cob(I)yrinic acid a,c-diamide adenosyltransferase [Dehalococcoidales bacterium]|nr:cob(I)yrinic acid a,c-diamide adenosyltransferase [Dehalococcoidales bacterium]
MTQIDVKLERNKEPFGPGLVQVFTGDGKGKTTAALGTVIRAIGHGLRVYIVFFMKGDYSYGERNTLKQLPGVTLESFGDEDFVYPNRIKPEQVEQAGKALEAARSAMLSGDYDLVVLDEINLAATFKLIQVEDILQLIRDKPQNVELILTGRRADTRIVEAADLVTEMLLIKHPFDRGIHSRMGIEY